MDVSFIDNINITLQDDLLKELNDDSSIDIIANKFSIFAYEKLKEKLNKVGHFNFIFNEPSFLVEAKEKERKEFYIPKDDNERSLSGSPYEIKLKNELTLKAVARECGEWLKKKAKFKTNVTKGQLPTFLLTNDKVYININSFTTVELGLDKGNYIATAITKADGDLYNSYKKIFDDNWKNKNYEDVTAQVIENVVNCYKENSPQSIYYLSLYTIFNQFLKDINEDVLPKERTGFKESVIWNKLYDFQKDAAIGIINKLETYNGCILADSVGLGKTFTALAVVKYYELRNQNVLVLCPKKLENNWSTYRSNYVNNVLQKDRFAYDVLFHTDLNRTKGRSGSIDDLSRINWGNYDLVVIDESHNFRNGRKYAKGKDEGKFNRYEMLMNRVIKSGVPTKVLMLSATPVNNRFLDLRNQLSLAYEGKNEIITKKMNLKNDIDYVFRDAQNAFNEWSKDDPAKRTTKKLLSKLSMDFFTILDNVTIARSRKHIANYYDIKNVGNFPQRLKPISVSPDITTLKDVITFDEIAEALNSITLCVYIPTHYVLESKLKKYKELYDKVLKTGVTLSQLGRELGTRHLMAVTLLKRLESSIYSFNITLDKIIEKMESAISKVENYKKNKSQNVSLDDTTDMIDNNDIDPDDEDDESSIGGKIKIDIADMDYNKWVEDIKKDLVLLRPIKEKISKIKVKYDKKFIELKNIIEDKIKNPINDGNKKVLIFTAFTDTAEYLYENLTDVFKTNYNINLGLVTGGGGETTFDKNISDINGIMTAFSPISKERDLINPNDKRNLDILIGTDCISEGQNLQDCDYMINYDIHWNPVRIVQRFGRIDRIGSKNKVIQLVNFWPSISLDEYLDLKGRVESRMKAVDLTATGSDNPIDDEEKQDLSYRKKQLQALKNEVVDMEDMSDGISITDLGLNDFRMDLLEYVNGHKDITKMSYGLNAIVRSNESAKKGVIFILKNINNAINIDNQNLLHPFYIVYISMDGEIIYKHTETKQILDVMKYLCRSESSPIKELCEAFNDETDNGRNMKKYNNLLGKAIESIIEVKDEGDIDAWLQGGDVDFNKGKVNGLDDFELISFIVID